MIVATWAGLVLVAVDSVFDDLTALVAHGFVGLRQQNMLTALVEGLDQPLAVDQVERCALGILLGGFGEAARGDEKSALCIGRNNRVVQPGEVACAGRHKLGGCGASCSGAQSKCGGRAIKGIFRRTIGETIGDHERTLSETERTLGETAARSRKPDAHYLRPEAKSLSD